MIFERDSNRRSQNRLNKFIYFKSDLKALQSQVQLNLKIGSGNTIKSILFFSHSYFIRRLLWLFLKFSLVF